MRRAIAYVTLAVVPFSLTGCSHTPSHANHERRGGAVSEKDGEDNSDSADPTIDPMGPNAACYVCHMTFVREEMSRTHLAEEVGCVDCHGPSDKHANDENIGATQPDILYARNEVDGACGTCHRSHDVPALAVVARFIERGLPAKPAPICTDCHGSHRIAEASEAE